MLGEPVSRRRFFARGASALAALTLDPERLLWVPGAKTIFLPAGTTWVTADWVTREALRLFERQCVFARLVNRTYDQGCGA